MNKKYLSGAIIGIAMIAIAITTSLSTGCKTATTVVNGVTNTVQVPDADLIASIAKMGVTAAMPFALKDPNAKAYLQEVSLVFSAAANSGNFSPDQLKTNLDKISVKELHSKTAQDAIEVALNIYKNYFGKVVNSKLDASVWGDLFKKVLQSIADGISNSLAQNQFERKDYRAFNMAWMLGCVPRS